MPIRNDVEDTLGFVSPEVPPDEILVRETGRGLAFLRVFHHRNYRLFFAGQLVSLTGNWITNVAQGWLVYSLSHSPLLLGIVAFAGQAPVFFLSIFGGMVSDRLDRRRMLIVTQTVAMVQSAILALLILTHTIAVWQVIALALFQGLVNAFDVPARQAMTVEMVGRADLRHAIAVNSIMFNVARATGPAIAGLLIATIGVGVCFVLDALSYGAVIVSLSLMRFRAMPPRDHASPLRAIRQGLHYAWRIREIRLALLLVAAGSAFGASYAPLLPAIARDVLHQGSQGLGFLYGAVGLGALTGAFVLAHVPDRHLQWTPILAALGLGLSLIAFSQSRSYPLSLLLLMPSAFCMMLLGASTNSIIQLASRDDMRGRVVALYSMGFMGMTPWGALLLGTLAEHLGPATAVTIGGVACAGAAAAALIGRRVNRRFPLRRRP